MIREIQAQKIAKALENDELETGTGLKQGRGLKRPGDTRWSSHYKTLLNIMDLFSAIFNVLVIIGKKGSSDDKAKALGVLYSIESFDFNFMAQLMTTIFGYTNDLCLALQRRDQDIINAMRLVTLTKDQLQKMRDVRWEIQLNKVIDLLLQELDNRFDDVNMELIRCMACFNPKDNFSSFDKENVLKLATFYPSDFSNCELMAIECQLDIFIEDMKNDSDFQNLQDIGSLLMKLVETKRDVAYPHVFLLIKLILILPVATASVERVFSGMTFVKNKLRNRIGDQSLNDCLVTFIEKDIFLYVSDDAVVKRFEEMKTRRKIN
ncbi:uncharacterized protein LOC121778885 [Salvia splendens]|uniref:uncharacterized protein LOC121778885 n=1 Tax=Salvia splendens TaxID=180675 RepID=UPI001C25190F|nr:uncharacterized protein LOC121778885 [Salvia splendens]